MMTELAIALNPEDAATYEEMDTQAKQELHDFLLAEVKRKLSSHKLTLIMDQASAEAAANDLTPEILEEILADDT